MKIIDFRVPENVDEGDEARLFCNYSLGKDILYTLKWYKNEKEFFRYEPRSDQVTKLFPVAGITVGQVSLDATTVVLVNLNELTSATFACEITADGTFQKASREKNMTVNGYKSSGASMRDIKIEFAGATLFVIYYLFRTLLFCSTCSSFFVVK